MGLFVMTALVGACQPSTPAPTSTPAPPLPTASPTFDFPTPQPSLTPTIPPTPTTSLPAVEVLNNPVYITEFMTGSGWDLGSDVFGATSVINHALSLVVNQPNTLRTAISPSPALADFYAELSFRADLCDGQDEFGLAFRYQPEGDHYRATLTCQGGVRLRRVFRSLSRALVPFLESSPAVFSGPLSENKLAVLATESDFRVFVNDIEVLSARDIELRAGRIGVVVESDLAGQTTVSFSNLAVYELEDEPTESPTWEATSDG